MQAEKISFLNKLIDHANAIKEDNTLSDDSVETAIETVLKAFPDFKSTAQVGGFQQIGGESQGTVGGNDVDDQLDNIFGVRRR